jgi:hypothetical protein
MKIMQDMTNKELAERIVRIHKLLNSEYESFQQLWISFDDRKIVLALVLLFICLTEVALNFLSAKFTLMVSSRNFVLRLSLYLVLSLRVRIYSYISYMALGILIISYVLR